MEEQIEDFIVDFFRNLKCEVYYENDILVVEDVPKSFEDIYGKVSPYRINFDESAEGVEFAGKGSRMIATINKYLEGSGKTALLRIDFEVDPAKEIEEIISLKNCKIGNVLKKHKNNFFSRFTFLSSFDYLGESEKLINEVYVHEGEVVLGDLSGYKVLEGDENEEDVSHLEKDYLAARDYLGVLLKDKSLEINAILNEKLREEVEGIRRRGDAFGEEPSAKVSKYSEFVKRDAANKYALKIKNKLVNTTVIYYPVFSFSLFLEGERIGGKKASGRQIEMTYNPLTKELEKISCESCDKEIRRLNLCFGGHISCEKCLGRCSECANQFCEKCLKRTCLACGRVLCKNCSTMCLGCGKYVCSNHLRKDAVSGGERCVSCLRACLRCHGLSSPKYFGEALDGSKVCQKCIGEENRNKVMGKVFGG